MKRLLLLIITLQSFSAIASTSSTADQNPLENSTSQPRPLYDLAADVVAIHGNQEMRDELLKEFPGTLKNLQDTRWAHAELVQTFSPKKGLIPHIALSTDGQTLYAAYDQKITLLDTKNNLAKIASTQGDDRNTVQNFVVDKHGKIYIPNSDGAIYKFDENLIHETTLYPHSIKDYPRQIISLALTPDDSTLYSLIHSSLVEKWDLKTDSQPLQGDLQKIRSNDDFEEQGQINLENILRVSPDNKIVFILFNKLRPLSRDHFCIFLNSNLNSGYTFPLQHLITSATFAPDGKLYLASSKGFIFSVNINHKINSAFDSDFSFKIIKEIAGDEKAIIDLVVSMDGKFLFSASSTHVKIWNIKNGLSHVGTLDIKTPNIFFNFTKLALSPDGTTLYVAVGNSIEVWKVPNSIELPKCPDKITPQE